MISNGWVSVLLIYFQLINVRCTTKPSEVEHAFVNNMTRWIQNDNVRMQVSAYMLFCPDQDLCFGDQFRRNYSYIQEESDRSCSYCSCSEGCERKKNCCPWRSYVQSLNSTPRFVSYTDQGISKPSRFDNVTLDCRKPITPPFERFIQRYFMVTSCPEYFNNADIIEKCERPEYLNDFKGYQPVTSSSTNETYKNIDCALCNAEPMNSLIPWGIIFHCNTSEEVFQIDSTDKLQQRLFGPSRTCEVLFVPPSDIFHKSMKCYLEKETIRQCNTTGMWKKYDADIENGCNSDFLDIYILCETRYRMLYKNIFCAMCNVGNWTIDLVLECEKNRYVEGDQVSFSALLDFRGKYLKERNQPKKCPEQQVYDVLMNKCHQIVCESGMRYENSECVPIHEIVGQYIYEVNILIKPLTEIDNAVGSIYEIINALKTDPLISKHLCFFKAMATDDLHSSPEHSSRHHIDHIALYALLSISELHSRVEVTEQLIDLFKLEISNLSMSYEVVFSGESFRSLYYPSLKQKPEIMYQNPMYDEDWFLVLHHTALANIDKCMEFTLATYPYSIVAPVTICTKVVIHKTETRIVVSNYTLCFVEFDFCVESEYFRESRDKKRVEVCLDQYMGGISAAYSGLLVSFTDEKILSAVSLSLSSLGCIGSVVIFLIFDEGKYLRGRNIIASTITLLIANILYFLSGLSSFMPLFCRTVGVLSHFFWLAVVMWLTVTCFSIFRTFTSMRFTKEDSLNTRQRFLWNSFHSFLVPCLLVLTNTLISTFVFQDDQYGYSALTCYISEPQMILYTFVIPLAVMVVLNVFMVIITAREINMKNYLKNSDNGAHMVPMVCKLATLTGAGWFFGFFHQIFQIQLFSYLQILITGSQGLFIFFAFALQLISKKLGKRESGRDRGTKPTSF